MVELWVDKYHPQTLDEYVWQDLNQRATVERWIAEKAVPHLMFSGVQGTGKTALAKLILRCLKVQPGDVLEINMSKEGNVDTVRNKIGNFTSTWPIDDYKYVLLEEADYMSGNSQGALRHDIVKFSKTVRFIITCNYPHKIIPALHSRLMNFDFAALDRDRFTERAFEVLINEGIDFDPDIAVTYIQQVYPDLRKCINVMQQNSTSGTLLPPPQVVDLGAKDYVLAMAELFKAGKFLEARQLVCAQAQLDDYPDIFKFLYRNLDLWGTTEDEQDEALLIIRRGCVNHERIIDPEINLAAMFVELKQLHMKGIA